MDEQQKAFEADLAKNLIELPKNGMAILAIYEGPPGPVDMGKTYTDFAFGIPKVGEFLMRDGAYYKVAAVTHIELQVEKMERMRCLLPLIRIVKEEKPGERVAS